ncbi:inorganic diphosphatase [Tautonia rosea]|uniref:inorganic diphosphatase n=1 Tax=Tautonia rosea TaxID=2728037 RepID=UPI0019D10910|nr:inorganic diphosphatase [Tautonia rosea]
MFSCLLLLGPVGDGPIHPFDYPQPSDFPGELFAVIEIPAGSMIKYEIDPEYGLPVVDRFQSMPVAYPANYGCFSQTLAGDDDPLDVLVFTRSPVVPGALIRVRPIGVLRSVDGGEQDDKIVAVPTSKIDPTYDEIETIDDLPALERQRLEAFFRVYKELPAGRKIVELNGFGNLDEALGIIREAGERYRSKAPSTVGALR